MQDGSRAHSVMRRDLSFGSSDLLFSEKNKKLRIEDGVRVLLAVVKLHTGSPVYRVTITRIKRNAIVKDVIFDTHARHFCIICCSNNLRRILMFESNV